MISENLKLVGGRIENALSQAGRAKGTCRLVAVSKTFPASCVQEAYDAGQRVFGENRVQELMEKTPVLPKDIEWHLIGHLQQNKVRHAVENAAWIHSIDTLALLKRVVNIAGELGRSPKLLLEVNVSGEESKFGMKPEDVIPVLKECPTPLCCGLMTVAPFDATPDELHGIFARLRDLKDQAAAATGLALTELSMGMSGDFEIAIAEGATMVRVGSAIFGHRDYGTVQ
ncbi:MAG: YggS family pyridoxal phosphate-dependent enzyme [Victivallales bacterium]|nr:YggS family pyridoxal phosphate-dependent enzyme [Victivallales bacterium]